MLEQKIVLQYLTMHFLSNVCHYNNQTGLFNEIFSADSHVKMWVATEASRLKRQSPKITNMQAATVSFSYVVL